MTKAIVIVEPRQIRKNATASSTASSTASYPTLPLSTSNSSTSPSSSSSSSSNSSPTSSLSLLPQSVDLNNDVMRMISSLSTVVQILTRMTNAAALELRHHPEREEGFQGLRMLLNYADQMYTTLLQVMKIYYVFDTFLFDYLRYMLIDLVFISATAISSGASNFPTK